MTQGHGGSWLDSTLFRVAVSAAVGVGVGVAGASVVTATPLLAALVGWVATASVLCVWTWVRVHSMDADTVRRHALREDAGRAVGDLVLLVASIAAVVGVGMLLLAGSQHGVEPTMGALIGVCTVVASWFVAHLLFMLRYAREHVADPAHGVDFGDDEPTYGDFAYLAYTIGMTFQVSDTGFRSSALRATALRHALLSYFLGAVVIACTINLVVQLASASA